ncbi:amidohydrolase family protein [Halorubrum sp. JWXQ-INN 858]|uniref:N-acyl-D-amino-acid deacylase family protein n=1 Tax=Halorubrum sp. JWXQ-INN 858 TaxID=2690782 RepID=UPI0013593ED2|nr:D-aminoacylase [Halorubrum sp. JWXQ-INN 858]MWV65067.1 amidohydrolase family protein [Halorubrum sp. JWXQ-INN 858]
MSLDYCLENARVVDGTGAPWFHGAVAVVDGRIDGVYRGDSPSADEVIDVDGAVVAPGFIDTHSHSDLELFADPTLEPKIRQGITTEVLGQDGFSMAPMHREGGAEEWSTQLGALAGRVDTEWTWGSVADYLDAVEESGVSPHVALLVGHGTVRFNVMGMSDAEPSDEQLAEMCELIRDGLDDGAVGFSTGLIYTPCTYASTEEVSALAETLQGYGRPFVAHVRSEGRWIWEALDEFVDIGSEHGVPLHLSHYKLAGTAQHGHVDRSNALLETARERGVDLTVEQYPYTAGSTMLSAALPPWVHAEGPARAKELIAEPDTRERIRRDIEEWRIDGWENIAGLAGWNEVVVTSVRSERNEPLEGRSIGDIAAERDQDPVETVCDLLVEEDLAVSMRIHMMDPDDVEAILETDVVNVATDGLFGGTPHPRLAGTFTRVLGTYVRDRNAIGLEEAVRKMTSLPARAMGLQRKGVIRPGMDADLVVFDPDTVESRATYEDPLKPPRGLPHVLVDGEFVVRDGETTGATPGRALRVGADD